MKISPIEVTLLGHYGDDLTTVNAARVSFAKESEEFKEGDEKLITYLAKHKHFSPFNHAFLSFRIKAPIFVARQLVKHRFMPWNEVSRRYVDSEPEFYIPVIRSKVANVKQGSGDVHEDNERLVTALMLHTQDCLDIYMDLTEQGVCPEQSRLALPHNLMTEWIWSGTLGAFADMLKLRLDPHTQKESRDVAQLIYAQALPLFPVSLKALLENK